MLVGGDRLTEANCRNLQQAFADGVTKEDRLEGMVFKFEDWHAIRVLFEVSNGAQYNFIHELSNYEFHFRLILLVFYYL